MGVMQFGYLKMIYFKASRKVFEMKNSKIPNVWSASLGPIQKKQDYGLSHRSLGFKPGTYKWHSWWTNWITGSSSPSSFGLISAYLQTFPAIKITWRLLQINEIEVQRIGGMLLKGNTHYQSARHNHAACSGIKRSPPRRTVDSSPS